MKRIRPVFFRITLICTAFICLLLVTGSQSFAQPGTLDPSFGGNGFVRTDIGDYATGHGVAIQTDGKIIVSASSVIGGFNLLRYNTDGSLDESFGTAGTATVNFAFPNAVPWAVTLLTDGSIVAAGTLYDNLNKADFAVAKFKADGKADSSFGVDGIVTTGFQERNGEAYSVLIQDDGKIVVGGKRSNAFYQKYDFAIVRYKEDGVLDSSFGSTGIVISDLEKPGDDLGSSLAMQADGKILLAGTKNNGDLSDMAVIRYNTDGTVDSSFGVNGVAVTDFDNNKDVGNFIYIQPDEMILVAGSSTNVSTSTGIFAVARLNTDGTPDISFGDNGKKTIAVPDASVSITTSGVATDGNDNIIISGQATDAGAILYYAVTRLNTDGILDNGFGNNGIALVGAGILGVAPYGMAIQQDNKIIVTGASAGSGTVQKVFTLRLNNDGVLPVTLTSFTATKKASSIFLNWQTATETNSDYFAIERSTNITNGFNEVGRVKSKGNSSQVQQYTYEDLIPLNGANYFRIKQADADGRTSYSKTVLIDFSKGIIIKLYPNPVKDKLTVEGLLGTTKLSIINLSGLSLATATTGNGSYTWNIKQLPAGTYYLRVEAGNNNNTVKFIKE